MLFSHSTPIGWPSGILGQGDLATLAETMATRLDQEEMQRQQEKMLSGKFTLNDFLKAMEQIKKLGS